MALKGLLKTPKGTRDWVGGDLLLRDDILSVSPLDNSAALVQDESSDNPPAKQSAPFSNATAA